MPAEPPADAPIEIFAECSAWLLVIGGTAIQSYGADRMTFDSDCAILAEDEGRLKIALGRLGYVLEESRPTFTRFVHLGRRRPVVDAMRLDAATHAKLSASSREVVIGKYRVRVPAPLHLVAMKLHALKQQPDRSFKDWPDICHLLETYRSEWTHDQLVELANRYASEQTVADLRSRGYL